jgi:hypothetical protein
MTAHSQDPHDNETGCFDEAPRRQGFLASFYQSCVQIGWNIASIVWGGKIREARDIALLNDFEGALAFSRKHERAISVKFQEMLQYPHQVDR